MSVSSCEPSKLQRMTRILSRSPLLPLLRGSSAWECGCLPVLEIGQALDRDCAANTCHGIEWDDRRWNGCASLAPV
jgi:hypothetical protein